MWAFCRADSGRDCLDRAFCSNLAPLKGLIPVSYLRGGRPFSPNTPAFALFRDSTPRSATTINTTAISRVSPVKTQTKSAHPFRGEPATSAVAQSAVHARRATPPPRTDMTVAIAVTEQVHGHAHIPDRAHGDAVHVHDHYHRDSGEHTHDHHHDSAGHNHAHCNGRADVPHKRVGHAHDHHDDSGGHNHAHCNGHADVARKRTGHAHDDDHHSHEGCDHSHDGWRGYLPHSHGLRERLRADTRSLTVALGILGVAFVLQIVGGYIAHSSMLVLEAVHSALDGLTVVISLLSVTVATRAPTARYTYGFGRAEVVSALVSVIALALLCIKLFVGAIVELFAILAGTHARRQVEGKVIMGAEAITLVANLFMALVLTKGSSTLNIRALRAHVIADSVENTVVLLAGLIITVREDWSIIDPALTLIIVVVIVVLNWGIAREAASVLLQGTPDDIDVAKLRQEIGNVEGVRDLGPVHVWTLTAGACVGSVVVFIDDAMEAKGVDGVERVREDVAAILRDVHVEQIVVQVCRGGQYADEGGGQDDGKDDGEDSEIRRGDKRGYIALDVEGD